MTTLDQHTVTARTSTGVQLDVKRARITLDESWNPYCQVELTCSLPTAAERALLDIRTAAIRLDLRARQDFGDPWAIADVTARHGGSMAALTAAYGGRAISAFTAAFLFTWNAFGTRASTARDFDLFITERQFDYQSQELTLRAESDEALMLADALVANTIYSPGTTSVRAIAEQLLQRIGATLQDGTANATVTADATTWEPGTSAWDYLAPLLQPGSLRLWCDEQRRWYLEAPQRTADGSIALTATGTLTSGSDTMTVAGDEWYDAVVVKYSWDAAGVAMVAYDSAGSTSPRNVRTIELNSPYPGAGAAAGILSRAQGRGRVLRVSAVSDYSAVPGQPATIDLPGTDTQTGYLSAISWSLPEAEMDVSTRGLTDTPPTAYIYGPLGKSYNAIAVGVTYNAFDWSLV